MNPQIKQTLILSCSAHLRQSLLFYVRKRRGVIILKSQVVILEKLLQNYKNILIYAKISLFFLFPGQIFGPIVFIYEANTIAHASRIP